MGRFNHPSLLLLLRKYQMPLLIKLSMLLTLLHRLPELYCTEITTYLYLLRVELGQSSLRLCGVHWMQSFKDLIRVLVQN